MDELARSHTLQQAYSYWQRKKGDRPFPTRQDLEPDEMKPFLPQVMLIDVLNGPLDFVYRVFGTGISLPLGRDYTRKSVRRLEPPQFAELIWRQYGEALTARAPVLHSVERVAGGMTRRYLRLTMPLSTDGTTVDKLFAVSTENSAFWTGIA
ncbi:MAG: PAS domain-containing protein [Rhodospirillaceae bacterium]|nr:PAS domain-containing protein [Rhodospirillaceae bacterium]